MIDSGFHDIKGMTLLELIALVVIAAVIAALTAPKLIEERKVKHAIHDVQVIAGACERFHRKFGRFPKSLNELIKTKQSEEWNLPFLKAVSHNPWGGRYVLDLKRSKVGIPEDDETVPRKYRFGGIAEISELIREDANPWQ
ncbi:type II secretion system protein GspG [Candidatus Poribacteria bacterium]|nr:type II secretion system protein GspG [Candidatus Poribacteria bacterium]